MGVGRTEPKDRRAGEKGQGELLGEDEKPEEVGTTDLSGRWTAALLL